MIKLLSEIIGLLALAHAVVGFLALIRGGRRTREVNREVRQHSWRRTARTLTLHEKRVLARATARGEVLHDPRLAGLVVQRARQLLDVREKLDRQHAGIAVIQRLLISAAIEGGLVGAWALTRWYTSHIWPFLAVSALCFFILLYTLVFALIFPPIYRRENQRLRRIISLHQPGTGS